MTVLTEALDRILNFWQQHGYEEAVADLQPGLSYNEIEEISKKLPIRLPTEVYELYQWRNGSRDGEGLFFPLEKAVAEHLDKFDFYDPCSWIYEDNRLNWLRVFSFMAAREDGYLVLGENPETCPVIFIDMKDYDFVTRKYASLTSKMLTFAECLENRCCDGDDRGYLIWRKYNISIVEKALEKLQNNLSLESLVEIAGDLMMYKDPRAVEPLIQALQVPLSQITDPNENMGVRALAARILGYQRDSRAIEPFILALRDGYSGTRYEAALALKDIGDERAVEPLIETLRDEHIETRFAAAEALSDIGDERAVEPLIEALRDREWNEKRVAIKALTKLISKFPELDERVPF